MARKIAMWVVMLGVLLLIGACAPAPADYQAAWQVWADANRPAPPEITLKSEIPSGTSQSVLYVEASSATATDWELYVDNIQVAKTQGSNFSASVQLSEGPKSLRLVALHYVWPKDDTLRMVGGPVSSKSELTRSVVVDTTPPLFTNLVSQPGSDGKTLIVTGLLTDATSGPCCVSVEGSDFFDVNFDGTFQVIISIEKVGVATSVQVAGLDKAKNPAISQVSVTLPPNRWERITIDGNWVSVNVTPGFNPFSIEQVGILQVLKGYGGDVWVQYVNGARVGDPLSAPKWWGYSKVLLYAILFVAVGFGLYRFTYWATAIQRGVGKAIEQATSAPATHSTALALPQDPQLMREVVRGRLFMEALYQFLGKFNLTNEFISFFMNAYNFRDKYAQRLKELGIPHEEDEN